MLTRRQLELLSFIHHRTRSGALTPTFEEMREAIGLHSKSGVHRIISALEERGFIRRIAKRARAIEIIKMPGEDYLTLVDHLEMVTECLDAAATRLNTNSYDVVLKHARAAITATKHPV